MSYRVLDLMCGVGAASMGYVQAGAEVTGVDLFAMPRYPFAFIQCDALGLDRRFLRSFDLVHASPPCQKFTALRSAPNGRKDHPDLIEPTRRMLNDAGVSYVIENVPGSPLFSPTRLCGSMFGLGAGGFQLRRHRDFESSFPLAAMACRHAGEVIGVYGGHVRARSARRWRAGGRDFPGQDKKALAREAMGIRWEATMDEISQAIPPAYTAHIGRAFKFWKAARAAGLREAGIGAGGATTR